MGKFRNQKGFGVVAGLLVIVLVAIVGFTGWYVYNSNKKTNQNLNEASTISSTSTNTANAKPDAYAGWKQYCSSQEKACFKYPSSWTFKDNCSADPNCAGIDSVGVSSPSNSQVGFASSITGRGGACLPDTPHSFITSVSPLPKVKGLYLVQFSRADINETNFGIDDKVDGVIPKTGDTGSCAMYTQFVAKNTPNTGVDLGGTVPDSAKSADLSTALLIMKSYYYQ